MNQLMSGIKLNRIDVLGLQALLSGERDIYGLYEAKSTGAAALKMVNAGLATEKVSGTEKKWRISEAGKIALKTNVAVQIIRNEYDHAEYINGVLHWTAGGQYSFYSDMTLSEACAYVEHCIASR